MRIALAFVLKAPTLHFIEVGPQALIKGMMQAYQPH